MGRPNKFEDKVTISLNVEKEDYELMKFLHIPPAQIYYAGIWVYISEHSQELSRDVLEMGLKVLDKRINYLKQEYELAKRVIETMDRKRIKAEQNTKKTRVETWDGKMVVLIEDTT